MKKQKSILLFSILLAGLFTIVLLAGTISAQSAGQDLRSMFDGLIQFIKELFGLNTIPIQKVLLAALLAMIVYSIVKDMFGQSETISWAISIIIAILSMMGISQELINAIAIQYGAMGAAMLTIIPLVIMIIFTLSIKSRLISRLAWLFYTIYYFMLYSGASIKSGLRFWETSFWTGSSPYYLMAIIVGLVMFFSESFFKNWLLGEKLKSEEQEALEDIAREGTLRRIRRREAKEFFSKGEGI
jgi:hypothetical protein